MDTIHENAKNSKKKFMDVNWNNLESLSTSRTLHLLYALSKIFRMVLCLGNCLASLNVTSTFLNTYTIISPNFHRFSRTRKSQWTMIGDHMCEYCRSISREKCVDKVLIGSMKGEGIVLLTSLFKKYIEMGLVCTNIDWVLETWTILNVFLNGSRTKLLMINEWKT